MSDPRALIPFQFQPASPGPDPVTATLDRAEKMVKGIQALTVTMRDRDTVLRPPGMGGKAVIASGSEMLGLIPDECTATKGPWTATQPRLLSFLNSDTPAAGGDHRTNEVLSQAATFLDTPYPVETVRYLEVVDGANDFSVLQRLGDPNRARLTALTVIER